MPRKAKTASGTDLGARIGLNIRNARKRLEITQSQLAEALELEPVTISRIETGAQLPSIDRLDDCARILKTTVSALLVEPGKTSAYAELLDDVMKDLPTREKEFLYSFAAAYAQHWKAGRKK